MGGIFSRLAIFDPIKVFVIILFIFFICLTFYGEGIYLTSIVLEAYTLPQLRKINYFKTQFIATHLFHGPISHILIYSGWILVFFALALLDLINGAMVTGYTIKILLITGGITGFVYALAQVYNGTTPYQFITGMLTLTGLLLTSVATNNSIFASGIATYFLALIIIFNLTLLSYFVFLLIRKQKIDLDRSGY